MRKGDLMHIRAKLTLKEIGETIKSFPKRYSLNTENGYPGFGRLIAFDKSFMDTVGEDKVKQLQRGFNDIRDVSNIESQNHS